jgi:hypothetical protein
MVTDEIMMHPHIRGINLSLINDQPIVYNIPEHLHIKSSAEKISQKTETTDSKRNSSLIVSGYQL